MNRRTLTAITKALDTAITSVAKEEFDRLCSGLDRLEIAKKIYYSLDSLRDLQRGIMPKYDSWVSLFYSLWYQPSHINLAYTLVRKLPKEGNPLKSGRGSLQVVDFGCGALAMQFGLAMALTDVLEERRRLPQSSMKSEDTSVPMQRIGWKIWHRFVKELKEYPDLKGLRSVCREVDFDFQNDSATTRWLTALHVAYRERVHRDNIAEGLHTRVEEYKPGLILITSHPENAQSAYSPSPNAYNKLENRLQISDYRLDGWFSKASIFRSSLYRENISTITDIPDEYDWDFVRLYLRRYDTAWVTSPKFDSHCIIYTRN